MGVPVSFEGRDRLTNAREDPFTSFGEACQTEFLDIQGKQAAYLVFKRSPWQKGRHQD